MDDCDFELWCDWRDAWPDVPIIVGAVVGGLAIIAIVGYFLKKVAMSDKG